MNTVSPSLSPTTPTFSPTSPSSAFSQQWFQAFWKIASAMFAIVLLLVFYRALRFYRRMKREELLERPRSPGFFTNQQASNLWGNTPGAVISGMNLGTGAYRTADGVGKFASYIPPEVIAKGGDQIVVAIKAEVPQDAEQQSDDIIIEAIAVKDEVKSMIGKGYEDKRPEKEKEVLVVLPKLKEEV